MNDREPTDFSPVVDQYARLEPAGADTWNPLHTDRELLHRLRLYEELCLALRRGGRDPARLRVLDVGCGTGRSSRVLLDFGVGPEQITGIDLRSAALDMARRAHPTIDYRVYDGVTLPLEAASMDWISVCTVMSSIPGDSRRRHLAGEIVRVLAPGGDVFYWDRNEAKDFAGGEVLDPVRLFETLSVVSDERVRIEGRLSRLFQGRMSGRVIPPLVRRFARPRTHRVCQLRKAEPSVR